MQLEEFDGKVDQILMAIEDAIEEADLDIEYDTVSGILNLEFPDRSHIIINRQGATQQIWVAAKSGGYHFNYENNDWLDEKGGELLSVLLKTQIEQQLHQSTNLDLSNLSEGM